MRCDKGTVTKSSEGRAFFSCPRRGPDPRRWTLQRKMRSVTFHNLKINVRAAEPRKALSFLPFFEPTKKGSRGLGDDSPRRCNKIEATQSRQTRGREREAMDPGSGPGMTKTTRTINAEPPLTSGAEGRTGSPCGSEKAGERV